MNAAADVAEAVLRSVRASAKYRDVHADTVTDVVAQEVACGGRPAEVEERVRRRLHRATASYLLAARPTALLRRLADVDPATPRGRGALRGLLALHASTAERLPDLDDLYPAVLALAGPGPVRSIADLACALNPLTHPWLRDVTDARYTGFDFNRRYVEIGAAVVGRGGGDDGVVHRDVAVSPPDAPVDVALLLKTFHCLEDRRTGLGAAVVERVAATTVVVSFPVRALHGRGAGFCDRHLGQLHALCEARGWPVAEAALSTERLLAIRKAPGGDR